MFMFPDTMITRHFALTLAFAVSVFSQESKPIKSLSLQEYETIVEEVLPCPVAHLTESRDFYLCMTIVPPGYRTDERELLVVLTSSAGNIELVLRRPEQAIWRFANEAYANNEAECRSLPGLQIRELHTSDRIAIERIVGRPWQHLVADVVPRGDLFADPTTYRIRARSIAGVVTADLSGPGTVVSRQPSALLSWAERVRKHAEAALQKRREN